MEKRKKIKFDYVRVYSYIGDLKGEKYTEPKTANLKPLLEKLMAKGVEERTIKYYGEEVSLQSIVDDTESGFWVLQFVRERTGEVPGIIDHNNREFKALELEENEFIGEEVTALYHEDTKVLMIQRNRNALGIKGLQLYFNTILHKETTIIEFRVVPFTTNLKELRKLNLRKISVNFAEAKDSDYDKNSTLIGIIDSAKRIKSFSTAVTFSVGRGRKDDSLSPEEVQNFINLTKENGFNKVHLEYKVDDESPLEIVELINGRLVDEAIMEYSKELRIEYIRVNKVMKDLFEKRLLYLNRIFGK